MVVKSRLTGITGSQLLNETTIAPDPSVDAIDFTVTDTNSLTAERLANAWATWSNVYVEPAEPQPADPHNLEPQLAAEGG